MVWALMKIPNDVPLGKCSTFGAGERWRTLWHYEYSAFGRCVFEARRISFRSRKQVLLGLRQIIENVWHYTRNGFGARKPPAERSLKPNVFYLSSGMAQGAQTVVFVVPEDAVALKVLFS